MRELKPVSRSRAIEPIRRIDMSGWMAGSFGTPTDLRGRKFRWAMPLQGKGIDMDEAVPAQVSTRRALLTYGSAAALTLSAIPAWAQSTVRLGLPGGPDERPVTTAFPQKGTMILQRTRPPLLETPFAVFDHGVLTPSDQFYVRWHWAVIPTTVDVPSFRLKVHGHVNRAVALSLADILTLPAVELTAVNQCSGNSRGFFQPRVAGGEWANGAMGNARWTGVRLKDVLDRAGVKAGAIAARFNGMDQPVVPTGPDFMKSLEIDHARDGEVMIAYAMNGAPLPLLNGFPLRLVVPGWYATYWIKMLDDIEVLDTPDTNFWMAVAYTVPDNPWGTMTPGESGVKMVPISRMLPRSFITNIVPHTQVPVGVETPVRGIAFGGDAGVAQVDFSSDGGRSWTPATLGRDQGKYGFRRWEAQFTLPSKGEHILKVRCTNTAHVTQPEHPNWNSGGFMRSVIEPTQVTGV